MRIAEVARLTGVGSATLRVWERRYGVPCPTRTLGGHRTYGPADVAAVRAVAALVDDGMRASEAARRIAGHTGGDRDLVAAGSRTALWETIERFDEVGARASVREATTVLGIPDAFDLVLAPTLRRLGDEWRDDPRNIAREHFATSVMRSHLAELLPAGNGPPTVLAFAPEGERHDLGLLMAAATLGRAGWNAVVLGADTPLASVEVLIRELEPALILVSAIGRRPALRLLDRWRTAPHRPVLLGGPGFRPADTDRDGWDTHLGSYADLALRTLPS